jgi:CRISPR-associated endonuclease/helicase Cas3
MFTRAREFLEKTYPAQVVNLQLLHGHAALSHELQLLQQGYREHLLNPSYSGDNHEDSHRVISAEWFTYRKRGLLAPFGVGTVDQALLSVLQTRHFFVRLFGLAGKTVIIDEVHAYEAYMTTLLERLLEWLAALGSPVVLLSATLPAQRRERLARSYAKGLGLDPPYLTQASYPRITWVTPSRHGAQSITNTPESSCELKLSWIPDDPSDLASRLQSVLISGGCAAVICNTVHRAQEVYQVLKPFFSGFANDGGPELDLFHSQFLYQDREDREKRALSRFGKPDDKVIMADGQEFTVQRPTRAILVATQVIEQSLDLDFDLMVTDIAPVDLLLQRAGRLHRHQRQRPKGLEAAQLWVRQPALADGVPQFDGASTFVYEPHLLLRTWLALQKRTDQGIVTLQLPDAIDALVQEVYRDESAAPDVAPALQEDWETTKRKMEATIQKHIATARQGSILPPHYPDDIFEDFNRQLDEENPEIHETLQAMTRLTEPTAEVILLTANQENTIGALTSHEEIETLLRHSVRISHQGIVHWLLREGPHPSEWKRSALLRHHRLVTLDNNGKARCGRYTLQVDPELGVVIHNATREHPHA